MTLTRFVRIQLSIFAVLTVIGLVVMGGTYVKLPAMFGIGRYEVMVHLAATGGLYQQANVALSGHECRCGARGSAHLFRCRGAAVHR